MKIGTKIFLIFFITGLVLGVFGIGATMFFSNSFLKDSIRDNLESTAHTRVNHVKDFVNKQLEIVFLLTQDHHVSDVLTGSTREVSFDELLIHARDVFKDFIVGDFLEILVLNNEGRVLISTTEINIGLDASQEDYFIERKGGILMSDIHAHGAGENIFNIVDMSSTINDDTTGEFLGVLVVKVGVESLNRITTNVTGLGETGEVYIVNKDGFAITPLRFGDGGVLKQRVNTVNYNNCKQMIGLDDIEAQKIHQINKHKVKEPFLDYRGVSVLGTHVYIPEMEWCLLAEIDESEAFGPLTDQFKVSMIIGFIFLIIVIFSSFLMGRMVSKPIAILRKGIGIIEKGNLNYELKASSKDEIGELSRAFDKMVQAVKKSRSEIDKKVEEQTKEIVERQKDVESQQQATLNVLEDVEREKERTNIEKEKVDTLLRSIGDGVFAVDEEMKVIVFNESAERISGFSSREIIGKKYDEFLKFVNEKDESPADGFIKDVMTTKGVLEMPEGTVLIRKDGGRVPVADSAAPIKDISGNIVGCIIVFRDITRKRKIEQMKSEFVSIASHQLRTPLTGIQWVSERLLKISSTLPEKERGYINDVYMSAKRLSRLVDDLLNVSRIEGGRVAIIPEKIDAVKFLSDYFQEINPLAVQKNITLALENKQDSIEMITDRSALQNIYQSLVSNAIEYTPDGGKVTVSLERLNGDVLFKVTDNGIGIPIEDRETIFEKFTRGANAVDIKTDGTGFGLYIAKQTTDLLGGEISFESEENKGTTFFVKLPIESKAVEGDKKLA